MGEAPKNMKLHFWESVKVYLYLDKELYWMELIKSAEQLSNKKTT